MESIIPDSPEFVPIDESMAKFTLKIKDLFILIVKKIMNIFLLMYIVS